MLSSQLNLAARNLARHRVRTLLSLCAIGFGVVALLLAGGFIEWIFFAMREASILTGLGHIHVMRPGFREAGFASPNSYLIPSDAPELETVGSAPGVRAVDQRLIFSGLASSGDVSVAISGSAVDPDVDRLVSPILPIVGEPLDGADPSGILLGRGLASALGVKLGDRVSILVSLPRGGVSAVEGHVRGTFATQVKAYDDSAVRLSLPLGRKLLRVRGSHVWVVALETTDADTASTIAYLKARLPPDRFEVASWLDLSDFYRKAVVLLSRQIDVVAFLIGAIIVLGISNTLTMNVLERTGEIGTLMAMGTSRSGVLRLFVTEGLLLGLVGGLAGLAIGFALAQFISFVGIPMPPPPGRTSGYSAQILVTLPIAAGALLVAIVSTALASVYPAWKASRLPIVDALRHNT